ncbi:MAG: ABC transporter permease, partial [Zoogloea sp.]|nr:ABC transporter permease [Zoogloea sp.]
ALGGGLIGVALTFPVAAAFAARMGTLFPVFNVSESTVLLQFGCALTVGVVAAILPMRRVARLSIVDGLRAVG